MSWFSGSGFAAMLKGIIGNRQFQESAFDFVVQSGQKMLENLSNPDKLKKQAQNMVDHPEVVVGAIVKGTEAEHLVDPQVVKKAEAELAKAH